MNEKIISNGAVLAASLLSLTVLAQVKNGDKIKLITLDPGHFHAALVQKTMLKGVDARVQVYAPAGPDLQSHLDKINGYNKRGQDATNWNEVVYTGTDFFNKMIAEKKGNVVVMAGNNLKKTEYVKRSIDAGFNVLGDKPMAIDNQHFEMLKSAFANAAQKSWYCTI
ncbi:hypothetical protein [Mucilaginibacter antarcticus]|uniref:hypothetical protein n=1 Tax=Mucilaginibacter antarcticus TaxID=1855725 RepID=UPI00363E87D4